MKMDVKKKPLVTFNSSYYEYPNTGYYARCFSDTYLDSYGRRSRSEWLAEVEQLRNSRFYDLIVHPFYNVDYPAKLSSIMESHGVFAERFFTRDLRPRLVRTVAHHRIERQQIVDLLSEALGRNYTVYDEISIILDKIFEFCVLDLTQDPKSTLIIEEWLQQYGEPQQCSLCGKTFRLIDLPDWVYFGGNGYKQCCFSCMIVDRPVKKALLTLIPQFVEECGFIPTSAVGPIEYSFTSRIPHDRWERVILAYARMGGVDHVKKKFGSWFKGLAETEALPEGVLTTARGIRCLSKDKHVCHSLDEQRIDNWLFEHNIRHEREPFYPTHSELNPSGRRRADWKVGDCFIEYFGLVGDPVYDKKLDEKLQLAELYDIELIPIYPEDIEILEKKLYHLNQSTQQLG
jgi:hypothetical protein